MSGISVKWSIDTSPGVPPRARPRRAGRLPEIGSLFDLSTRTRPLSAAHGLGQNAHSKLIALEVFAVVPVVKAPRIWMVISPVMPVLGDLWRYVLSYTIVALDLMQHC